MKQADPRLKTIVLFADSTTVLKHYASELKKNGFQIVWWVYHSSVKEDLEKINEKIIMNTPLIFSFFYFDFLNKIVRHILFRMNLALWYRKRVLRKMVREIQRYFQPELLISDSTTLISDLLCGFPKALAFRTVNFKEHNNIKEVLGFDLVLMPSEFQRDRFYKKFNIQPDSIRFPVIGWPRVEELLSSHENSEGALTDSKKFLKKLELDVSKKTILFAPTWDSFYNYALFPQKFIEKNEEETFCRFCALINELGFNLIIRLHPYSRQYIIDSRWRKIAEERGAFWTNKEDTGHIEDEMVQYLRHSDVLISDTSGIITDFMILNKPVLFFEPDHPTIDWSRADLPPDFRTGPIIQSLESLKEEIQNIEKTTVQYANEMKKVTKTVLSIQEITAKERAAQAIQSFLGITPNYLAGHL